LCGSLGEQLKIFSLFGIRGAEDAVIIVLPWEDFKPRKEESLAGGWGSG
jgi:hypothetical protein